MKSLINGFCFVFGALMGLAAFLLLVLIIFRHLGGA